ncbi:MAG: SDR family NAD(P)-dependent oxidoreductase, partial [Prevotellaceae bacterium]|nr:SDR family NAD(P)-dependent oxidoreductase [Prevotellaceae bacterium]
MTMYNPFSLEGKTILVTGASSGIGRATAIECSKMGATIIITGRNAERLQETFDALEGNGHQQFIADLSEQEGIDALVA